MIKKLGNKIIKYLEKISMQKEELIHLSLVIVQEQEELNVLLKKILVKLDTLIQNQSENLK